jgi:hypothetical protein
MNVSIDLFAPTNLDIIEKAPPFSLAAHGEKMIRSCIKFSSTCNSYIFGQANYTNNKGAPNSINLSGIFIDLLVKLIFNNLIKFKKNRTPTKLTSLKTPSGNYG